MHRCSSKAEHEAPQQLRGPPSHDPRCSVSQPGNGKKREKLGYNLGGPKAVPPLHRTKYTEESFLPFCTSKRQGREEGILSPCWNTVRPTPRSVLLQKPHSAPYFWLQSAQAITRYKRRKQFLIWCFVKGRKIKWAQALKCFYTPMEDLGAETRLRRKTDTKNSLLGCFHFRVHHHKDKEKSKKPTSHTHHNSSGIPHIHPAHYPL